MIVNRLYYRATAWPGAGPLYPGPAWASLPCGLRSSGRPPIRPQPPPLSRAAGIVGTIVVLALIAVPAVASRNLIQDLVFVFTMLALAQLWNALAGWGGLVSVGQQAFVGLGAYALFAGVALAGEADAAMGAASAPNIGWVTVTTPSTAAASARKIFFVNMGF